MSKFTCIIAQANLNGTALFSDLYRLQCSVTLRTCNETVNIIFDLPNKRTLVKGCYTRETVLIGETTCYCYCTYAMMDNDTLISNAHHDI